MSKSKLPKKAYKNLNFLNSTEGRAIRILAEYLEPKSRFQKNKIVDTVVMFGSARLKAKADAQEELDKLLNLDPNGDKDFANKLRAAQMHLKMSDFYEDAVELSRLLTEWSLNLPTEGNRFIICSGGGPGIMEAANRGAKKAGGYSIGLNISLPFEQFVNEYVSSELSFEFHYFFMRKFWFVYLAKSLVVFPGGFGTLDELMEVLTLAQTGKIRKQIKTIIYGEKFWKEIINFDALVDYGVISAEDFNLFEFCNTPQEAFDSITEHFQKYYLNRKKPQITL